MAPPPDDRRRPTVMGGTHGIGDRRFDVHANVACFCALASAPAARPGGVVVTTLSAKTAGGDGAVHAAANAAVRVISRLPAAGLVRRGVRVNAVALGFIDTPTLGVAGASASDRTDLERSGRAITPMRRLVAAAEVARAAVFLALEATCTTGRDLQVDGGLSELEVPA